MRQRSRESYQLTAMVCTLVVTVMMGGVVCADDYEGPIDPGDPSPPISFGDVTVETPDLGGTAADVMATLDPPVTALLAAGEIEETSDDVVTATTQPVLTISAK